MFLNNTTATTGRSWYFNSYSNGNLYVGNTTAGDIFNFLSTGAATFSGALSGTSATFTTTSTNTESGQIKIAVAGANQQTLHIGYNTTSDYAYLNAYKAGIGYKSIALNPDGGNVLIGTTTDNGSKLQVTGAATFSGSVTATGGIAIGTSSTITQTSNIYGTYASESLNSSAGNFAYTTYLNGATGGGFSIAAEGSAGGTFATGTSGYAGVLSRTGAYSLQFATNGIVRQTIASTGAATFSGALSGTSATFSLASTGSGAVLNIGNVGSGVFGGLGITDGGTYPLKIWGSELQFLTGSSATRLTISSTGALLLVGMLK